MNPATTRNAYTATPVAPSSPELEMAVLGCCQYHPTAYATAAARIGAAPVFHEKQSALLWDTLRRWYADHPDSPPDDAWIVHELIDTDGMNLFAAECRATPCASPNIELYVLELLRLYRLRESRNYAGLIARAAGMGDIASVCNLTKELDRMNNENHYTGLSPEQIALADKMKSIERKLIGASLQDYESFSTVCAYLEKTDTPLTVRNCDFFDLLTEYYHESKTPPTGEDFYRIQYEIAGEDHNAAQRATHIESEANTIHNFVMHACSATDVMGYCRELTAILRDFNRLAERNISNVVGRRFFLRYRATQAPYLAPLPCTTLH